VPNLSPAQQRHALGLLSALATLALLSWRLRRPALWLDESASVVATQRTWPNLWRLRDGAEAPLVPYYALLKVLIRAITGVVPGAAQHLEVLYRLPSMIAVVLAVWILTVWLARICPPGLVISTVAVLLTTEGLSRYGQEVRPYGLVLMLAVISMALWSRMINDGRRRWLLLYALVTALMVAAHDLSAGLVGAQLVAALVVTEAGRRRSAVLRTIAGAALALVLVSPVSANAIRHGTGPSHVVTFTPEHLGAAFLHLFTLGHHPFLWVGGPLLLALVGLTRVASPRYRFIARLAAVWAIVPAALLTVAVALEPNLLIGRYMLFSLPGWAILGGLGIVTVFDLVRRATRHLTPALAVAVLVTGATMFSQLPTLQGVRMPDGHGEDIRPALAAANTGPNAPLPIYSSARVGAIEVVAYSSADTARLVGISPQRNLAKEIWPSEASYAERRQLVGSDRDLLLLLRVSAVPGCSVTFQHQPGYVARCMPSLLRKLKFRVVSTQARGRDWTLALLERPRPPGAG
jgi:Dolichyl-phosphate-mannose-protein mannosyltransferase